jgi:hypothetical protein
MRAIGIAVALASGTLTSIAVSARAQAPETPAARADRLFSEGKAALEARRYGEACPKLAESQQLDPGTGTLLALGLCHEGAGKLASAWRELVEVLDESEKAGRADRAKLARQHIPSIEPQLSKLTVRVSDGGAAGLRVRVDGEEVPPARWGSGLPVDPGDHIVDATADGQAPWKTSVHVGDNADQQTASLPPQMNGVPPAATATATTTAPPEQSPPSNTTRTVGFVVGGAGIVAVGVGAYFGVRALGDRSDATGLCPSSPCTDPNGVSKNDSAKTEAWVADFAIGLGLVAVGVGVYLAFVRHDGPTTTNPATGAVSLVPIVGPGEAGVGVGGRW